MFDSCYFKSRTRVYPYHPPRHISGITPKKFLRRPLHPSQELHRCSGIWTPVRLNKGGQLPLTLRSVSCYSGQKIVFLITNVPYTFSYTNRRLTCNCSARPLILPEDAERLPTWLIPTLSCEYWTQTRPQASPKQSEQKKNVMEGTKDRGNIETSTAKVSRGDAEGPFIFLRGLKPSVFWSPYKYSLVLLYFILFFFSRK